MNDQTAAGLAEPSTVAYLVTGLAHGEPSICFEDERGDYGDEDHMPIFEALVRKSDYAALVAQLEEQRAVSARMEADARRYRLLRRKVAIAGGKFCILNLSPTYVAPDAGMELDAVLDIELKPMLERWGRLTKGDAAIDAAIASQQAGGKA